MIYLTKAKYLEQYKIYLIFNNNKEGVLDLKDIILHDNRKIFKELIDMGLFTIR